MRLFDSIKPGSRVTIVNRFGQQRAGRCVMKFPDRAILNMGGPHGSPGIATDANVVKVNQPKEKA